MDLLVDYKTPRVPWGGCYSHLHGSDRPRHPGISAVAWGGNLLGGGRTRSRPLVIFWMETFSTIMGKWVVWGPGWFGFFWDPRKWKGLGFLGVPGFESQTTWAPNHPFTHYSWTFLEDSDSHSDGHMTWILVYKRDFRGEGFLISTRSGFLEYAKFLEISWSARMQSRE